MVRGANDNNGPGDPRTVVIDVSALGTFNSTTQLTLDATTNLTSGPAEVAVTPAQRISVSFAGYGVTFLTLEP